MLNGTTTLAGAAGNSSTTRKALKSAAVAFAMTVSGAANATEIHFTFSPDAFYTYAGSPAPTPVMGSFDYDTVTVDLSNVDYTSVSGHFTTGGQYYSPVDTEIYFGTLGDNYDVYQLASSLDGGGSVQINSGTHPDIPIDASGSLVADVAGSVPEAATWAMMILGMGAIGFAMRRQKVTSQVSYAA